MNSTIPRYYDETKYLAYHSIFLDNLYEVEHDIRKKFTSSNYQLPSLPTTMTEFIFGKPNASNRFTLYHKVKGKNVILFKNIPINTLKSKNLVGKWYADIALRHATKVYKEYCNQEKIAHIGKTYYETNINDIKESIINTRSHYVYE